MLLPAVGTGWAARWMEERAKGEESLAGSGACGLVTGASGADCACGMSAAEDPWGMPGISVVAPPVGAMGRVGFMEPSSFSKPDVTLAR